MASPTLQFFSYSHLSEPMRSVSKKFHDAAHHIVETLPNNIQREQALVKLLEAKDCAVRAMFYKDPKPASKYYYDTIERETQQIKSKKGNGRTRLNVRFVRSPRSSNVSG
jgi:hypothetical protein